MKIIDFERKGNLVRFYLGEKTDDWGWTNKDYKDYTGKTPDWLKPSNTYYGDDWNDYPYDCNAGPVYPEFIKGYTDICMPFDDLVLEPDYSYGPDTYCKDDLVDRKVPCIVVVPHKLVEQRYSENIHDWCHLDEVTKYYFGDELEPTTLVTCR